MRHHRPSPCLLPSSLLMLCTLLSACAGLPDEHELDRYDALADRGQLAEAEQGYDTYLAATPLEDEQWQAVRSRRCAVTARRVRADFQQLVAEARPDALPARQALLKLHEQSKSCGELHETTREIERVMIESTEVDVEREVQPLYDSGQFLAMVSRAPDFSPMLPAEHRYARWFGQVRQIMGQKLEAMKADALANGYPATSFYYGMLQDELQGRATDKVMPEDVRRAFVKKVSEVLLPMVKYQLSMFQIEGALGECQPLFHEYSALPDLPLASPLGVKVEARATFSSCEVEILQTSPLPGGGTRIALRVLARAEVTARQEGTQEESRREVSFDESHTFDVSESVSDSAQALAAVVAARGHVSSPYPFDLSLTDLLMREHFPKMFSHEQIRQGLLHSSRQTNDPSHQAERLLAVALTAPQGIPREQGAEIASILGVNPSAYPGRILPEPQWLGDAASRLPRRRWEREPVVARQHAGIASLSTDIGASYALPEQGLVGQPDRSALGLDVRSVFRLPLLMPKGRFLNWGFLFGLDAGFFVGKRFGEDYQDLSDPGIAVYEPEEELQSFGFQLGVSAMMGWRGSRVGMFAGLKPDFFHRSFGFYRNQGARTPIVGRLEFRMSSARSILIEGWGWNINVNSANSSYGGSVWLPLGESESGFTSSGLVLRAQQDVLPAVFYGLNQTDDVRIEEATLRSGGVSYFIGF